MTLKLIKFVFSMTNKIKYFSFFIEIIPISLFFIVYSIYDIYLAAVSSALSSLVILIYCKFFEKRISYFAIFSLTIAIIFTILSVVLQNPILIKIQPTIFNGLFAIALIGGLFFNRPVMKDFFSFQFKLNMKTWKILSKRWGIFFLILSLANEIVWRYFTEDQWVFYKTFISSIAVLIFMSLQIPITIKGKKI